MMFRASLPFWIVSMIICGCSTGMVGSRDSEGKSASAGTAENREGDGPCNLKTAHVPMQSGRPDPLKVSWIPLGVRYHFASDQVMVENAALLARSVETDQLPDGIEIIWAGPGFWHIVHPLVGDIPGPRVSHVLPDIGPKGGPLVMTGALVMDDAKSKDLVWKATASMMKDGGKPVIRALTPWELAEWWPFLSFDIDEPAYMVESASGKYRIAVMLSESTIMLEELNETKRLMNAAEHPSAP